MLIYISVGLIGLLGGIAAGIGIFPIYKQPKNFKLQIDLVLIIFVLILVLILKSLNK